MQYDIIQKLFTSQCYRLKDEDDGLGDEGGLGNVEAEEGSNTAEDFLSGSFGPTEVILLVSAPEDFSEAVSGKEEKVRTVELWFTVKIVTWTWSIASNRLGWPLIWLCAILRCPHTYMHLSFLSNELAFAFTSSICAENVVDFLSALLGRERREEWLRLDHNLLRGGRRRNPQVNPLRTNKKQEDKATKSRTRNKNKNKNKNMKQEIRNKKEKKQKETPVDYECFLVPCRGVQQQWRLLLRL